MTMTPQEWMWHISQEWKWHISQEWKCLFHTNGNASQFPHTNGNFQHSRNYFASKASRPTRMDVQVVKYIYRYVGVASDGTALHCSTQFWTHRCQYRKDQQMTPDSGFNSLRVDIACCFLPLVLPVFCPSLRCIAYIG